MSRGDRPVTLDQLVPYFRGARSAALVLEQRHGGHDPDLKEDVRRYVGMVDRYTQAAIVTFKLKRSQEEIGQD